MGLFDRLKEALAFPMPDPNRAISGTPARGRIIDPGSYDVGGEGNAPSRWSMKQVTLVVIGAPDDQLATTVSCFLGERAHRWANEGREVPILLDPTGAVLGIDVTAWEAEVDDMVNRGVPRSTATPTMAADAREWQQDAGSLDVVEGVDFDTYVSVEATLATEAVAPADWELRAAQLGIPHGRWAAVQTGWQARMRTDWKLASRFGAAYAAATGQ